MSGKRCNYLAFPTQILAPDHFRVDYFHLASSDMEIKLDFASLIGMWRARKGNKRTDSVPDNKRTFVFE